MKTSLLLLILVFNVFHFSLAQNPLVKQWDYRFGGTGSDILTCMQQTRDGGYILAGYSNSGISGDKSQPNWDPSGATSDYWIVKIDSLGNYQWDKRFGGNDDDLLVSMQQTSDGGYILGGYSQSGISGDKSQPIWDTSLNNFVADYWIVKIDSAGIKEWDKDFGGASMDFFCTVKQTTDGGYILGGYSQSDSSGDKTQHLRGLAGHDEDFWIIKIDSRGNKIWDRDIGGAFRDDLVSISLTIDSGYSLGGFFFSGIGGDKSQDTWGNDDYWVVKIDSLGNKIWDKDFGGSSEDELHGILQTTDGGYLLGGWSLSDSSGDKTENVWGFGDYWIVKIDSHGNKQWDRDLGGSAKEDEFGSAIQTADGGYLISGTSYSNISGNKSENNLGTEQTWIVKINSLGTVVWDKTLKTNGINHDESGLAIQTSTGCYAIANQTNAGIGGDKTQSAWNNSYDYWITKFCDSTAISRDGIDELVDLRGLIISPNPTKGAFVLEINSQLENNKVEIFNVFGELVYSRTINGRVETITCVLNSGIYLVKADIGEKYVMGKLIVQ